MILKGNINHGVCQWCYDQIPIEDFFQAVRAMGITSVDALFPDQWALVRTYGMVCAIGQCLQDGFGVTKGWNRVEHHDQLIAQYEKAIPMAKEAGVGQLLTFAGNCDGMDKAEGLKNCAKGLKQLMPVAEQYGVTITMELLNSKVDHPDYMGDHVAWGIELCDTVGSENFRLLYDIYHMQIMDGNVIDTINSYHPYFAHYHCAGVPGRAELDGTQELYYPAIIRAINATGYTGFVSQEFVPQSDRPLQSLQEAIRVCDI